jgi:metal-responsive CopG/Arc/MetJ family transcriptional regulator
MRTIIEVPKEILDRLTDIGARHKIARAEVIRRALFSYLEQHSPASEDQAFGLWQNRLRDGLAISERVER